MMLALNLGAERQALIQKWSRFEKKMLGQMLVTEKPLDAVQQGIISRIALTFFKSRKSQEQWRGWLGENAIAEKAFQEKYQALEQRKEVKKKLLEKSSAVQFPLGDEVDEVLRQYFKVEYYIEKWADYSLRKLYEMGRKGLEEGLSPEKSLALGSLVMKQTSGIKPYDIQLIAVLAVLAKKGGKGRLAQVKTGEGKTLIITLLAFVLVMQQKSVDIVTSSHYLAMRDQKKGASFFKEFGIVTAHICEEAKDEVNFDAHILYGKATDYEFALMREKIQHKKLFVCSVRKRAFDCVIVDEVDNMMIDTASSSARISYPSLRKSRQAYYPIIYAYVQNENNPTVEGVKGAFVSQNIQEIPFSEEDLGELISSAQQAMRLKEEVDYVIQKVADSVLGSKLAIKIIDQENTGQILDGMRWSRGLHEFLELKHGIALDQESMTPISLSHATFYPRYESIYGLSGTLGSTFEREHIQTTYEVDPFDLPTYRPLIREDLPLRAFKTTEGLRAALCATIKKIVETGRPVLVLCPTIHETREIGKVFQGESLSHQLYNEMQEEKADVVIQKAGNAQAVTISTNNAGRGTDIVLTEEALTNGGLHVVFTYHPSSKRVEDQGIGRAGRQGQVGSSEIFVVTEEATAQLEMQRLEKEQLASAMLTERAQLEREINVHVEQFWGAIGTWKEGIKRGGLIKKEMDGLSEMQKEKAREWVLGGSQNGAFVFLMEK
ncbi:MAG: hypothetical protein KDK71_07060, partial [Chlamydiia bacterium]|nr:hypothetical protein [Chlamydiia bacterium]